MTTTAKVGTLWCHDCKRWEYVIARDAGTYTCRECGSAILCDYCGRPWTDDGQHDDGPACHE